MCNLAVDQGSNWLMVDDWEATQPVYMPTAKVLDHFDEEINQKLGGVAQPDGKMVPVRILLLAGADLIQTMSTPGMSQKPQDTASTHDLTFAQVCGLRMIWNICE